MSVLRVTAWFLLASTVGVAAQQAAPAAPPPPPPPSLTPPPPPSTDAFTPPPTAPAAATPTPAEPVQTIAPAPLNTQPSSGLGNQTPNLAIQFPTGGGNGSVSFPNAESSALATPQGVITVNLPDEDIRNILRNVADIFDLNLVIPEGLTGRASVKLRNVTWQQVFQVVLEPAGYTYTIDNNIIKIRSRQELTTEPVETRVFLINSARASELQSSLTPLIEAAAGGRIQVDNRTNALVVTERPTHMNNIQEIIERLDRPTQQVSIESKFIELNVDDDKTLGIQWDIDGTSLGSIGTAWQYNIAHGLGATQDAGVLPPRSVPLSVPSSTSSLGTESGLNGVLASGAAIAPQQARRAADLTFFNQSQYDAVLRALQQITDSRLVSNPTVVTLDNEEISFLVGQTITIVFPQINNQTGQATPGENKTINVGIQMRVKPQVTNNGFINLTINPEISRLDAEKDTYFGGTYPRIDTRKLTDAKISIKDGYTLALGGLINDEDDKNVSGVPVLDDLPWVGDFFKSTEHVQNRQNLIIFITAKTLNPDGATFRDVIDPNLMIRSDITNDEIPGYYDPANSTPGMVHAPENQLEMMKAVQAARDQNEQEKELKELDAMKKESKSDMDAHLGK